MIAVAKFEGDFGRIEVMKSRKTGAYVYLQGKCYQSETDQNGISLLPYVHAIYGLLADAGARDVLMIGCGGGSLGTMLSSTGVHVTIVDINRMSFQIAREYFSLPETIECHVADGAEFLAATRHHYDAIVMDAYAGTNIPSHLRTHRFFRLVRSHLDPSKGCFFANIIVQHDLDRTPDGYAASAAGVWDDVRLLDKRGALGRNAVVMAGNVKDLPQPTLRVSPSMGAAGIAKDLNRMAFRLPRR